MHPSLKILSISFDNELYVNGEYQGRRWKNKTLQQLKIQIEQLEIPGFFTWEEKMFAFRTKNFIRPVCQQCGGKVKLESQKPEIGFRETCSVICAARNIKRKIKTNKTLTEKYNGHWMTTDEAKKEFRKIGEEKYNGLWPGSFNTIENKQAIKEKYGVDNVFSAPDIKIKIKETFQKKYGVDNPMQVQEIRDKSKQTCLEKYGVEYPIQHPDIFAKCMQNQQQAAYKFKKLISKTGKHYYVQGYEGPVIQYLLDTGIQEDDLTNHRKDMPVIQYEFNGKQKKYFPDMLIKSQNLLIEVKSSYTFSKEFDKNMKKHSAAKKHGFFHHIIIWDDIKKEILETIE
jgi:predicted nucleic-acid-binding protein